MLLQTNSYVVPREKRAEHARLMLRFRQCFKRLGSVFEVYEQTGPTFTHEGGGRFVQIMRFRDRHHQQEVHDKEQKDPVAQQLIADFCQLLNISYQQQHGLFSANYYAGILPDRPSDKPELLVSAEAEYAIRQPLEEATPHVELSQDSGAREEELASFLQQEPVEYKVEQQTETMEDDGSIEEFDPESLPARPRRHDRRASRATRPDG